MTIDEASCDSKSVDKPFRNNDEPNAKSVEEHLRKGSNINDRSRSIEAVQRRNRLPGIAIFRVVFIFDNPCPRTRGPGEKFDSSLCGHDSSKGKLIGWCYIHHTGGRR